MTWTFTNLQDMAKWLRQQADMRCSTAIMQETQKRKLYYEGQGRALNEVAEMIEQGSIVLNSEKGQTDVTVSK